MLHHERLSSLDDIARRCCTLCAVHQGTLAYIVCRPDEESHMRDVIFKENLRIGNRFVWYEMRKETVIGDHWSRIRLIPYAGTIEIGAKLGKIRCDYFGIEELTADIRRVARQITNKAIFCVRRKNRERSDWSSKA